MWLCWLLQQVMKHNFIAPCVTDFPFFAGLFGSEYALVNFISAL